jgi:DNA-directed RNA polymerase subunit M/transcription elongation factor TFIIS
MSAPDPDVQRAQEVYRKIMDKESSVAVGEGSDDDDSSTASSEDEEYNGMFTCMRCKSKKTTFYLLQTRSADEPMTAYITCISCGNKWKN